MEVILQPPDVGKFGKGDSVPNQKDYETCSEEEATKKLSKTKLVAPSTILKDRIEIAGDMSLSSPVLGTKRKKGPKEGSNKKMAIRSTCQMVEMQVASPLKLDGGHDALDSLGVDLELLNRRRYVAEEIANSIHKIQMLVVGGKGKEVFVNQDKVSSS